MGIKIVLPKNDGLKTGIGTKVFNESGEEIEVQSIDIHISPDEIITAIITVPVDTLENADFIIPLIHDMPKPFIESELKKLGYKLVKDE